jgi:hypothetical protein
MNSALPNLITSIAVMTVFRDVDCMFRAFIGPKLEKSLGRKLTEWDWRIYWEESGKRAEFEARRKIYQEWQAQAHTRRVIHDFVWNNDS